MTRATSFLYNTAFLLTLILCISVSPTPAAEMDKDLQSFLKEINNHSKMIKSLSCKLTQEKHLALFSKPVIFHGRLAIVRPEKLRWEFSQPISSILLFNGSKGLRCNDGVPPVHFDLDSDPVMKIVAEQLWTWLSSDYEKLAGQYRLELKEETKLLLTPLETNFSDFISQIIISFHPENKQPERVEIREPGGDKTILFFYDFELDLPLEDSLFNKCSNG